MRDRDDFPAGTPLFDGIEGGDISGIIKCLNARFADYSKSEVLFLAGDPADKVGLVAEGTVQVVRDDIWGNRTILAKLGRGSMFGETFACAGVETLPVCVIALSDVRVLFLDYRRVLTTCTSTCSFHSRMIENMLKILARKNLLLNRKIEVLSARRTREKVARYLSLVAADAGGAKFSIPFNRQDLADYLSVERSALSREMSNMRAEGLIDYDRNNFEILKPL